VPTENQHGDADASTATEVITLSEDESGATAPNLTLEELNRNRAKLGLPPRTLEETNRERAKVGLPPLKETPGLAEPNSIRNDFIANREEVATGPQWTEQDAIRIVKRGFQMSTSGCQYPESGRVDRRECYLIEKLLKVHTIMSLR
jgi:HIND motif